MMAVNSEGFGIQSDKSIAKQVFALSGFLQATLIRLSTLGNHRRSGDSRLRSYCNHCIRQGSFSIALELPLN